MRTGGMLILLLAALGTALGTSACASTSSGNSNGGSSAPSDGGTWQTVSENSGSSVSQGSGTNENSSQQTTSVNGAYRVLATCQGGGLLSLQLDPGGAVGVQCTPAKQEPVRVAGSDSAPPNGQLSVTIKRNGDVAWSDVLVQVRR